MPRTTTRGAASLKRIPKMSASPWPPLPAEVIPEHAKTPRSSWVGFSLWDEMADLLGDAVVRVELAGASGQAGDLIAQRGEVGDTGIEGVGVLVEQR